MRPKPSQRDHDSAGSSWYWRLRSVLEIVKFGVWIVVQAARDHLQGG